MAAAAAAALSRVADVEIDGGGVFKYVLVRVRAAGGPGKDVVRGHGWAEYHGLWASRPLRDYGEAESRVSGLRDHLGRRRLLTRSGWAAASAPAWSWCSQIRRRGSGSRLPVLGSTLGSPGFSLC
ncbi:14 kDa phosphohistidine phosphatase isoform X1 [Calonectris borealis]|uniref:14 kDa phosphohistidine phosphatase isoform X1 n=1 Tax=Calonectris borealis TaxID=1323832 RepID=UPI003F4C00DC